MMGKTHYKLGALWYITFIVVPFVPFIPIKDQALTFAGIWGLCSNGTENGYKRVNILHL